MCGYDATGVDPYTILLLSSTLVESLDRLFGTEEDNAWSMSQLPGIKFAAIGFGNQTMRANFVI